MFKRKSNKPIHLTKWIVPFVIISIFTFTKHGFFLFFVSLLYLFFSIISQEPYDFTASRHTAALKNSTIIIVPYFSTFVHMFFEIFILIFLNYTAAYCKARFFVLQ